MRTTIIRALTTSALPIAALGASLGVSTSVAAQEEAAAETRPNVILVTARKVEESIQDVPISITAFTAEEIANRSITELEDVALLTPGLVFEDYSNGGFGTPVIRGATQFSITGLEQNVSVFLDGIYIPRQYAFDIGSMNLERIEVVKGPQSALYGANAFAGAINYVSTSRSLTETSAHAEVSISENGGYEGNAKINLVAMDGQLSFRAAGGYSEFGGDWENNFPGADDVDINPGSKGKLGGYEKWSAQVGLTVRPIDALTVDFDYYHFDVLSETRAQFRLVRGVDSNCSPGGIFGPFTDQLFCGRIPNVPIPSASGVEGIVVDPRSYGLDSTTDIFRAHAALELTDNVMLDYQYGHIEGDVFSAGNSERDPINGTNFRGRDR